jgi:hypothetical protein
MIKYVITGTYRTGSSALAESIGLTPGVACGWEWMGAVSWLYKIEAAERALNGDFSYLHERDQDHMAQVFKPECSWLGFRALFSSSAKWILHPRFSPALWIERLERHVRWLETATNIRVIHIMRLDALDWLKSVYLAKKTGLYVGKAYPEGISVRIPVREAVARLRTKEWIDARLATLAQSNSYLRVNYEDFFLNQDAVISTTLQFLDCTPTFVNNFERKIYKQSKGKASDYILNFEELSKTLKSLDLLKAPTE